MAWGSNTFFSPDPFLRLKKSNALLVVGSIIFFDFFFVLLIRTILDFCCLLLGAKVPVLVTLDWNSSRTRRLLLAVKGKRTESTGMKLITRKLTKPLHNFVNSQPFQNLSIFLFSTVALCSPCVQLIFPKPLHFQGTNFQGPVPETALSLAWRHPYSATLGSDC
jgi:hypothetical protein